MTLHERPRVVHLTTTDISLELLLGPQLSAMADAGYEVIAMSAPGPFVDDIEARGIRHFPLANTTRSMDLRRDVAALLELRRAFVELKPDIVHTHNPKPGVYGRIAAKLARVPIIINTVHGLYALPEDRWPKKAVVYSLERLASTCSGAELIQNPEDIDTLRTLRVPEAKLVELGNGVDLDRFSMREHHARRRLTRETLGVPPDALVVGAVGRLVAEKGYPELFKAWETVLAKQPHAQLIVVGPDEPDKADSLDRAAIRSAEELGIRFYGMRDDVEEIYHALDCYVLASHREGYPRSAMEAAACGLPIVATDIRGCRQVVDDGTTGFLFPARDADALAAAILEVLGDDARRNDMALAAVERAQNHFDQADVISRTLATYERLGATS